MTTRDKAQVLFYAMLGLVLVLNLASVVWAYGDAKQRNKSPLLVSLLVFWLQFPLGLIAWLVFRPAVENNDRPAGRSDPDAELKQRANEGRL